MANTVDSTVSMYSINNFSAGNSVFAGNVGIGTSVQTGLLQVNGNVGVGTGITATSTLTIGGKCLGLAGDLYLKSTGQVCVCTAGTFPACTTSTCC